MNLTVTFAALVLVGVALYLHTTAEAPWIVCEMGDCWTIEDDFEIYWFRILSIVGAFMAAIGMVGLGVSLRGRPLSRPRLPGQHRADIS